MDDDLSRPIVQEIWDIVLVQPELACLADIRKNERLLLAWQVAIDDDREHLRQGQLLTAWQE